MTAWKWLWRGTAALIALGTLSIAALLFYYRPSIEYAYVDIIGKRERPVPGWHLAILGSFVVLLVGAGLAWLKRKANPRS